MSGRRDQVLADALIAYGDDLLVSELSVKAGRRDKGMAGVRVATV